jgi:Mg-chelatase subunit ChlD
MNNKKGQMRILESLIACILILTTFYFIEKSNYSISIQSGSDLKTTADNLLNTLENQNLLIGINNDGSNWVSQVSEIVKSSIPSNVYYNITFYSEVTDTTLGNVNNLNSLIAQNLNTVSTKGVYSLSYPMLQKKNVLLDVMLVIDRSGSMNDKIPGDKNSKLYYAKLAAQDFVTNLNPLTDKAGLASFETTSSLDSILTSDLTGDSNSVKNKIGSLVVGGSTDMMGGINKANTEINTTHARNNDVKVMILLTDGVANYWEGLPYPHYQDNQIGCQKALQSATVSKNMGVKIFTIGLGPTNGLNQTLLNAIQTDGYYYSPSAQDLTNIYQSIAQRITSIVKYDVILINITLMEPAGG